MIKLIGETHDADLDVGFQNTAKQLVKNGRFVLVLENAIFSDYKDGLIETNVYAIEDKIIWEYNAVILALYEIYPVLKRYPELGNKTQLEMYGEMPKNNPDYSQLEEQVNRSLGSYTESYCNFLANTQDRNPVAKILFSLFRRVIDENCFNVEKDKNPLAILFASVQKRKREKQYSVTEDEINFVRNNLDFFNQTLRLVANYLATNIRNGEYSDKIKAHKGISEEWVKGYFDFKFIDLSAAGRTLLDYDVVCIDLRNQLFIERLVEISSQVGNKDIWFIVGERHLDGLEKLFSEQFRGIPVEIVRRNRKQNLVKENVDEKQRSPGTVAQYGAMFVPEKNTDSQQQQQQTGSDLTMQNQQ